MGKEVADNYLEHFGIEAYKEKNLNTLIDYGRLSEEYQLVAKDDLQQSGILGMKWGVIRSPEQLGRKPSSSDSTGQFTIKYSEEQSKKLVSDLRSATSTEKGKDEIYFGRKDFLKNNPDIKEAAKAMDSLYKDFSDRLQEAIDFESTLDDDKEQTKDERKTRNRLEAVYEEKQKEYYNTRDKLVNNILGDHENDEVFSYKDFIYGKPTSFTAKQAVEGQIQEYMNNTKYNTKFQHSQDFSEEYLSHFGNATLNVLSTQEFDEDFLAQSGILGMHWGIIRTREALARLGGRFTGKGKKKPSEPLAPSTRTKRLSELTDEELNKVIARLQKEKLYKDLVNPQGKGSNPVVQKGETIVHKILSALGTGLAKNFAEGAGTYLANKFASSRQAKINADAANEKARYELRNQKLEKARQKKYKESEEKKVKVADQKKEARAKRDRAWNDEGP